MAVSRDPRYVSAGDVFLTNEAGAQGFEQQNNLTRDISLTLTNASGADQKVIIVPSRKPSDPARVIKTGNIVYANGANDLACAIDINSVEELLAQIKDEPIYLLGIKITSNVETIGSKSMLYTVRDVFKPNPTTKKFSFSKSQSQFANNNKIFDVQMPKLLLSDNTELSLEIPKTEENQPTTSVTLQLIFGLSISLHTALENKAIMAGAV